MGSGTAGKDGKVDPYSVREVSLKSIDRAQGAKGQKKSFHSFRRIKCSMFHSNRENTAAQLILPRVIETTTP